MYVSTILIFLLIILNYTNSVFRHIVDGGLHFLTHTISSPSDPRRLQDRHKIEGWTCHQGSYKKEELTKIFDRYKKYIHTG